MSLGKECSLPMGDAMTLFGSEEYRQRLRHGSPKERQEAIAEAMELFPVRTIGTFVRTLRDMYGERPAVRDVLYRQGEKPPIVVEQHLSYRELADRVEEKAEELLRLGVQKGDRIGMVAEGSGATLVSTLACQSIGAVVVPWTEGISDAGLTASEAMEQADARFIIVRGDVPIRHLLVSGKGTDFPRLGALLSERRLFGLTSSEEKVITEALGSPSLHTSPDDLDERMAGVSWHDPAYLLYSAGTGGMTPKLVEISHGNLLYEYLTVADALPALRGGRCLHVLPPYHIFGTVVCGIELAKGTEVNFSDGRSIVRGGRELLQEGKYGFFAAIPTLWTMMRRRVEHVLNKEAQVLPRAPGVRGALSGGKKWVRSRIARIVQQTLEEDMLDIARKDIAHAEETRNPHLCDKTVRYWTPLLVEGEGVQDRMEDGVIRKAIMGVRRWLAHRLYSSVCRRAGIDNLVFGVSGASVLPPRDRAYFEALKRFQHQSCLGTGYGLTEGTGICTLPYQDHRELRAMAGRVIPGTMAWTQSAEGGVPEVCIAGPGVGRYIDPVVQEELLPGGVLHTGDVGAIFDVIEGRREEVSSFVHLSGRIKRMVKCKGLSILPEPIERLLEESDIIKHAYVTGDGQDLLGVLIVPSWEGLRARHSRDLIPGFDPEHPHLSYPRLVGLFEDEVHERTSFMHAKQRSPIRVCRLIEEIPAVCWTPARRLRSLLVEEVLSKEIAAMWAEVREGRETG